MVSILLIYKDLTATSKKSFTYGFLWILKIIWWIHMYELINSYKSLDLFKSLIQWVVVKFSEMCTNFIIGLRNY